MSKTRASWWWIYAVCVAGALAILVWITLLVLDLERAEHDTRLRAEHQAAVRDALWRMDSWFSPLLAREAARPYFEYLPFYAQEQSYTRLLNRIEPGEVLIPSPLLAERFEHIRLHFQVDSGGVWTSPKVPTGNQRDLVEGHAAAIEEYERSRRELEALSEAVDLELVRDAVASAENELARLLANDRPVEQTEQDLNDRAQSTVAGSNEYSNPKSWMREPKGKLGPETVDVGSLVPIWLGPAGDATRELCFVRRVRVPEGEVFQGFACDWPRLRETLLQQAAGAVRSATLEPASPEDDADPETQRLATVPAALRAPFLPKSTAVGFTPAKATLLISWFAGLLAVTAVGITLRASIAYGEKRSRFASAVTHELRTPLTTFRMYSEMLAKDMVKDEATRREYLETLEVESDRLAHLVENVLTYARLEDGRREPRRERVTARQVFERLMPKLGPRCDEAEVELDADVGEASDATLVTDVEAVGQILFNLVDNACKYGRSPDEPRVHVDAEVLAERLAIRVRDHGLGVPVAREKGIFGAFDRGDRDPAAPEPGVGLGLALARGLARDLGGDLVLERRAERGACFRLELPLAG